MIDLSNKTVLITGASSGIGEATVKLLADCSANIVMLGRNSEKLEAISSQLKNKPIYFSGDLNNLNFLDEIIQSLKEDKVSIDGLVLSAGIEITKPFKIINTVDVNQIFNTNVFSQIFFLQKLIKNNILGKDCSTVFISSIMAHLGKKAGALYGSTKSALIGLCKSLSVEYSSVPFRFNIISPGIVKTRMVLDYFNNISEDTKKTIINSYPLGFGEPIDVANLISFLISPNAKWITGSEFIIDGGFSAQ